MRDSSDPERNRPAIFLDRDGVINVKLPENRYVSSPEEFHLLPGVIEGLAILKDLGFLLVLITNQRGIGRGLMSEPDLRAVHRHMEEELADGGVRLDGIYFCPHDEWEKCGCRKPEPGMILSAGRDLGVDLANSYMVGDSPSDMLAARRAGARAVRIGSVEDLDADLNFGSLRDFALYLRNGL